MGEVDPMKKTAIALALASCFGCTAALKLPGTQDQTVEIVRTLARAQAESIKALTDALTQAQAKSCEVK